MNQKILKYLKTYSYKEQNINRLLVSSFLRINGITNVRNIFIADLIITDGESEEYQQMEDFINLFNNFLDIEVLLELFEFVISPEDKEVNGAVFTPKGIREYIVQNCITPIEEHGKEINDLLFADIACGCGGFFKTITEVFKLQTNKTFYDIYKDNLFGVDIQEYSIIRTKILLSLFAIVNGEDEVDFAFNLYIGNSLEFNFKSIKEVNDNGGFDIIVGNPPYVGASKIDDLSRDLLKNWSVTEVGKSDLYIPFFQIALENLNNGGTLGYITVSTFQKSLNARLLRSYFSSKKYDFILIDFGGEQIFKNRSTYTCICIITKSYSDRLRYVKSDSYKINYLNPLDFLQINYNQLNDYDGWYLVDDSKKAIIDKIEGTGEQLGKKYEIKNGFATLRNNVYLFSPMTEDEDYYYFEENSNTFKIEKLICRDAIKPNTLKLEDEIIQRTEKLIFPYTLVKENTDIFGSEKVSIKILAEQDFKERFPHAYKYLFSHKDILSKRDKGNRNYEQWYAYGRNQALTLSGFKLFLPYITDTPCFVFSDNKDLLFYNGYAIMANNADDLLVLKKILMSKLFWFYIKNTSRPYSGRYYSVAKNYIKKFGICALSEADRLYIMNTTDEISLDKFICSKYGISYKSII